MIIEIQKCRAHSFIARCIWPFGRRGLDLVSAMPRRNADAKRPGMHSNAKRWNEAVMTRPKLKTSPVEATSKQKGAAKATPFVICSSKTDGFYLRLSNPSPARFFSMWAIMSAAAFSGSGSTAKVAPRTSSRPSVRSFTTFMLPVMGGMGPRTV